MILALGFAGIFLKKQDQRDHSYRVERNRVMAQVTSFKQIKNLDLKDYEDIKKIETLSYDITDNDIVNNFYLAENHNSIEILPFYQNDQLQGYVKFIYQLSPSNTINILWISEGCLLIIELLTVFILIMIKRKIIKPFWRLNDLPLELSQGHFKGSIKEEKNKYFGKFLWGLSQLQDTLDTSKVRQLELLKEKKKMLLSLSHDMKTPLNLIKLYSKALKENIYTDPDKRIYAMDQINNKADEIEQYVEAIITSSREDILDLQVVNSEFYLSELLLRSLAVYQEQCALRQIELVVHPYSNRLLKGDLQRSLEVLENLFENAFKYGDGRKIEISFEQEDNCQLIHFYNTGSTVSDTEFNHIFESFYRGANSQGKRGNGLGLYICRELMRKMDGAIFAKQHDKGMSFTLVFR